MLPVREGSFVLIQYLITSSSRGSSSYVRQVQLEGGLELER
jgi:hypothetical protein